MNHDLFEALKDCGAPLLMFAIGLFFPQVKIGQILDALRPRSSDKKE